MASCLLKDSPSRVSRLESNAKALSTSFRTPAYQYALVVPAQEMAPDNRTQIPQGLWIARRMGRNVLIYLRLRKRQMDGAVADKYL